MQIDFNSLAWFDLDRHPYSLYTKVDQSSGAYSQQGLATKGLNGCNGLIARTRIGDYGKHGIMTHYDPTQVGRNIQEIERLLREHPEMIDRETSVRLFYPKGLEVKTDELEAGTMRLFRSAQIKKVPYDMEQEHILFTGTEGVMIFDVFTGQFKFEPFRHRNPDFQGFL